MKVRHRFDFLHSDHSGHRARLRQRFWTCPEALADYEVLELLLAMGLPRRDTKSLAKALLERLGGLHAVFAAPRAALQGFHGLGACGASSLRLVMECFRRCLRGAPLQGPLLGNSTDVVAYLRGQMTHKRQEEFRVLFLDHSNRLIADDVVATGGLDSVVICPRNIAQKCLFYHASGIIIAHNHPAGAAVPSGADLHVTQKLQKALEPLGVKILEHVIVARHQTFSFLASHLL